MRKKLSTIFTAILLLAIQNCSNAYIMYNPDADIKFNYISYDYDKLLAFSHLPSDDLYINDNARILLDIDTDMSIAKIIDDNFSLEMDLDANAKKQLKPKANVIEGYKIDSKTSKCVEKVIKPHIKKYKIQEEVIGDEIENIDVDQITNIKEVAVKQKKERIAKEKKQRQERIAKAKLQNQNRVSWFNFFKRTDKSKIAQADNVIPPEVEDIDSVSTDNKVKTVSKVDKEKIAKVKENTKQMAKQKNTLTPKKEKLADNNVFDADKIEQQKLQRKQDTLRKKEEARIAKENLKLAKPHREKPVKVAKVKGVNEKEKVKPVKVAKAEEPKAEKVKPIKIAKVEEPKPIKVRGVNEKEKVKPIKVAKVEKPTLERIAKVEPKQSLNFVETQKENEDFDIDRNSSIKSVPQKQAKLIKEKPVKVVKAEKPKTEKVKPIKIAKVEEPKPIKVKGVNVEEKVKPVKVAKIKEPKAEKVKPVKIAKVEEPKPIKVKKEKPVKIAEVKEVKPMKVTKAEPKKLDNKAKQSVITPTINSSILTGMTLASATGRKSSEEFTSINTRAQVSKGIIKDNIKKQRQSAASAKPADLRPIKIAKGEGVKVKEKVKPVKIAKVEEPKPIKVKGVNEKEKVKPIKVAKVEKPTVERIAKVEPKQSLNFVETQKENEDFDIDRNSSIKSVPQKQAKLIKEKPVKVVKAKKPKTEKVKPVKVAKVEKPKTEKIKEEKPIKVAKVKEPKAEKVKPVKIAKIEEPKPIKVKGVNVEEKVKPVKVAKVKEPKAEKVKPVKIAKIEEPKPIKVKRVNEKEKVKPVKSIETKGVRTVASKTTQHKKDAIKPVSQIQTLQASKDLFKIDKPQETPMYSAFETMQNRLPITRKPFDSDDM